VHPGAGPAACREEAAGLELLQRQLRGGNWDCPRCAGARGRGGGAAERGAWRRKVRVGVGVGQGVWQEQGQGGQLGVGQGKVGRRGVGSRRVTWMLCSL